MRARNVMFVVRDALVVRFASEDPQLGSRRLVRISGRRAGDAAVAQRLQGAADQPVAAG